MAILLRIFLTLVLAFGLIGFGSCSLLGLGVSIENPEPGIVILAVIGAMITLACGYGIYSVWFKNKR